MACTERTYRGTRNERSAWKKIKIKNWRVAQLNNNLFTFVGKIREVYPKENEWYQAFLIEDTSGAEHEDNRYTARIGAPKGQIHSAADLLSEGGVGSLWEIAWKNSDKEKTAGSGQYYKNIVKGTSVSEAAAVHLPNDLKESNAQLTQPRSTTQLPNDHLTNPALGLADPAPRQGISKDEQIARAVALKAVVDAGDVFIKGDASYQHVNSLMDNLTDMLLGRWSESHPAIPPTPEEELFPAAEADQVGEAVEEIIEEVQE